MIKNEGILIQLLISNMTQISNIDSSQKSQRLHYLSTFSNLFLLFKLIRDSYYCVTNIRATLNSKFSKKTQSGRTQLTLVLSPFHRTLD